MVQHFTPIPPAWKSSGQVRDWSLSPVLYHVIVLVSGCRCRFRGHSSNKTGSMHTHVALILVAVAGLTVVCVVGDAPVISVIGAASTATSYLVLSGSSITLVCNVTSVSPATGAYSWRTSTGDQSCDAAAAGSSSSLSVTLTAAAVTCYRCTYTSADGSSTQSSQFVLFYPYEPPSATTFTANLAAVASVSATCGFKTVSPLVNVTFSWTRITSGNSSLTGSVSTATNSTLLIANSTTAGDKYYCHGVVAGTSTIGANAKINGIDGVLLATYEVASPPYAEVHTFDKEQYIEGDTVTVSCQALGYPTPSVTWKREGAVLNVTSQQTVVSIVGGVNVSFTIASLNPDTNRGAYVCVANGSLNGSSHSYASAAVILHARSKLAPLWPAIGIIAQLAVLAIVIAITEHFRTKKAAAAAGKGSARLGGNKKSPDTVDAGGNNAGVSGKTWKATM